MAAKFSPSDAALSIFSFAQSNQSFTLKYMAIFAIFTLLTSSALAVSGFYEYSEVMNEITLKGQEPSMEDLEKALSFINPLILGIAILFSFILGGVISAIGLRKAVLNQDTGPQFGTHEKNILIGGIGLFLIMLGVMIVGSILTALIAGAFASAVAISSLVGILGFVGIILSLIFVLGRFGQYGIFAVARNENGLKASYEYTDEGFWSFIGAYVLSGVVLMLLSVIFTQLIALILNVVLPDALFSQPPNSSSDFFKIGNIIFQVFSGAIAGFLNLAFICVGAYIWHQQPIDNSKTEFNTNGNMV